MNDAKPEKGHDDGVNRSARPDLDAEEYRDGEFYKPISTREYFKLFGYCLLVLVVIAVGMVVVTSYTA